MHYKSYSFFVNSVYVTEFLEQLNTTGSFSDENFKPAKVSISTRKK
jgi:hypothetical protein